MTDIDIDKFCKEVQEAGERYYGLPLTTDEQHAIDGVIAAIRSIWNDKGEIQLEKD